MIAGRSRAKRALQKVSELKFYDDTDDEDEAFEEVPIDRDASEIDYLNDRYVQILDEKFCNIKVKLVCRILE